MIKVVYVGYDPRYDIDYQVCRASILRRTKDVHIIKLAEEPLRAARLYTREWREVDGQRIDHVDGTAFSTEFAFSRFLVPNLALRQGWALFCDSDMLFTADLASLFDCANDRYAAMVVKHDHRGTSTTKMRGATQAYYKRKNWSSLVLWNCEHPAHKALDPWLINHASGQWLHAFSWLKDEEIGELPRAWNYLVGVSPAVDDEPPGIHFTLGTPWTLRPEQCQFGDLWWKEFYRETLRGVE